MNAVPAPNPAAAPSAAPAASGFQRIADVIRAHARRDASHAALIDGEGAATRRLSYGALDADMDRVARALQAAGLVEGDCIAICSRSSIEYATVFLGAVRAGVVVAPLAPGSTTQSLQRMLADCEARLLFIEEETAALFGDTTLARIALDGSAAGEPLAQWLDRSPGPVAPVEVLPGSPFNVIYSSGTTGEPKGIVQSHAMRWVHVQRGLTHGYGTDAVTVLSTPLYSNTTLVLFLPTLAYGGTVVLMPKFDVRRYLALCVEHRATHTMLVPVQYQRLLAHPDFDSFDLSNFRNKFCTSAPFSAELKADVLRRWPGGLIEYYGMTEGGASCILEAHRHPDKLHTVGRPAPGCEIRMIDDHGVEVPRGELGEVVGHSGGMMIGYHGQPAKTREVEWFDPTGKRFIRTGDIGRFDAEGFVTLMGRKKDMIISGGFNIYPADLEAVLDEHPQVLESAVVGVASQQWGESPAGFVVLREGAGISTDALLAWANDRVGKTQRLVSITFVDELPRSAIGKVLKRELRDRLAPVA